MPTGLEHEAPTYPIVLSHEVQPLLAHVGAFQFRSAGSHYTHGISTGMAIYAFENTLHQIPSLVFVLFIFLSMPRGLSFFNSSGRSSPGQSW